MRIRRAHELGLEDARKKIDHLATTLGKQYSLTSSWSGDRVHVRGSGVRGQIVVTCEYVEAEIHLGIALIIMQRQIRSRIEELMDEHFGQSRQ